MLNPFRAVGKHSDKASSAATPGSLPNTADSLYDLANSCKERYQQTGDLTPLNGAITHYQAALKQTPAPSADRAGSLNQELAIVLYMRYREMHQLHDLEASIACDQEAVKLFPPSHPKRSISFYDLGVALFTRFEETGGLQYLEESITYHRDALELRPASHPDRYVSLNNLANALFTRFQRTRLLRDLDGCIAYAREALELTPADHHDRSVSLNNLAQQLKTRFSISRH